MRSSQRRSRYFFLITTVFLVFTTSLAGEMWNIVFAASASGRSALSAQASPAPADTAVTTYKENNGHTGDHTTETILNTSNVNQSDFGKRVVYQLDGQAYTQPLYLPDVTIGGTVHNVVYEATENDSVYAFDADSTDPTAGQLWHTSFLNPPSVVAPSNTDVNCNDMVPSDGLSGTPVIDPSAGILYVVAFTKENGSFVYRLHALDVTTGQEMPGSPIQIQATVSGTGAASVNGKIAFNPQTERQRTGLILANGQVYIGWGSFCDDNPYHGWIMGYSYNGTNFTQESVYNDTPNSSQGGIWGAGGAIVADANGNIYYVSGNGGFDGNTGGPDFGDSFVKLNAQLTQVEDYFAPFNQECLNEEDGDLGSGGPLLVPGQNRIIGAGKEGRIYVVNTASMGHYNTITDPCDNQSLTNVDKIVQELPPATIGGFFGSSAYWQEASGQQFVYFAGSNDHIKAFTLNSNGTLSASPSSTGAETFGFTGGNPTVSSNNGATGTGIVWALGPTPTPTLRAYDATNLSIELYSSTQNPIRDNLEGYVKFTAPTVANGEVFVGTTSTLDVFGLITPSGPQPTSTVSPTPTSPASPPPPYNNTGLSDDPRTTSANYDGLGNSYSAQALNVDGIAPGSTVTSGGFAFIWPNVASGTPDNYEANGLNIPVTPVPQADHLALLGAATNGATKGTATILYTNGNTQTFTLGFTDWATKTLSFGNTVVAVMPYRNTPKGQQNITMYLFMTVVTLQPGKTVLSVTLPTVSNTPHGGEIHVFAVSTSSLTAPIYNNVGITDDGPMNPGSTSDNGNLAPCNYDGGHTCYSAQALQKIGILPGWTVTTHGYTFDWPDIPSSATDNYQADGQQIAVTPTSQADHLAFLGSAANGAASGTATITYTDGSKQTFTLGFTDWATKTLSFGNVVVATMSYRDTQSGLAKQSLPIYLFLATVALQKGKMIQSVTLPATIKGGQIHVFAVATSSLTAPVYNNAGITNDGNVGPGNFDGGGRSYSAQALQSVGVNAGDNAFNPDHTVVFTWPNVPAGSPDNYQCTGQVIPITPVGNASTLAFLGSAGNGPGSGTATITYTDGTTQTFTLGFSDWTLGGGKTLTPSFGNLIAYTPAYRSNPAKTGGKENVKTYIFYASVQLMAGKTIASVTLPSVVTGGQMHVFAITTA